MGLRAVAPALASVADAVEAAAVLVGGVALAGAGAGAGAGVCAWAPLAARHKANAIRDK